MTVHVIGLGYTGLPTALLIARERRVVGVDIDADKVAQLNEGTLPFEEAGLRELFDEVGDQFSARTTLPAGDTSESTTREESFDTYLIATPTPLEEQTGVADLRYVREALEGISEVLSPDDVVVLESTVPPGTSQRFVKPMLMKSGVRWEDIGYTYCPERAIPGNTLYEMTHNDRVIGTTGPDTTEAVLDLYTFVEGDIRVTDPTTAEFVKLAENTHRDVNIAVANEFARLAEMYGIDGHEAIELANQHPRVNILSPGPGVGGHCIPIDPNFLTQQSSASQLISTARGINNSMTNYTMSIVREMLDGVPRARVAVLGVAYKGNVDDARRTPAYRFHLLAENEGYDVRLTDPHVDEFDQPILELEDAVADSDCLVILTDHDEYTALDPGSIGSSMRRPNVVDTRALIDRGLWEDAGFHVRILGDGRGAPTKSPID